MSNQQVNLFQEEFLIRRDPLPPKTMGIIFVVGLIGGISVIGFDVVNLQLKQDELATLEQDLNAATNKQAELSKQVGAGADHAGLQQKIKELEKEVSSDTETDQLINQQLAKAGLGFSSYLTALGKHPVEQMWLTGITVSQDKGLTLRGQTYAPGSVLHYLRQLSDEALLNGTSFKAFHLAREEVSEKSGAAASVSFFVSTGAEVPTVP